MCKVDSLAKVATKAEYFWYDEFENDEFKSDK